MLDKGVKDSTIGRVWYYWLAQNFGNVPCDRFITRNMLLMQTSRENLLCMYFHLVEVWFHKDSYFLGVSGYESRRVNSHYHSLPLIENMFILCLFAKNLYKLLLENISCNIS